MGGTPGHRYRRRKEPKKPVATAQEVALERRQTMALDKSIEDEEERFKALRRGMLGNASLLSGASATSRAAATNRAPSMPASPGGGNGSLLGGGGGGKNPARDRK